LSPPPAGSLRRLAQTVAEALFRVLFTYDAFGEEKIPAEGGVVVAANHPSYLDPVLLSLRVARPIRFMAWEGLFKVPLLGALVRAFGAFPVDTGRGKGREAYERARDLVQAGEVVGIFPEGKRSRTGWMEPGLREGAARLALETGAPLVPATITGAYRAWPHFQSLPKPARIRVRFHDAIDPAPYRGLPEAEALEGLLAELRRRVERSLLPGIKADLRTSVIYGMPPPWPRGYEAMPALALAVLLFWKTRSLSVVAPVYAYLVYLLLDHFLIPPSRLAKWVRNASPVMFILGFGPWALRALGLPEVPAGSALAAMVAGALFPYLYEHGRTALGFVRGMVLAAALELGALHFAPLGAGPHVALPLFAAAYAWDGRTVFWRYAVPVLTAYALGVSMLLRADAPAAIVHALAGLFAWLVARLFPYRPASPVPEEPKPSGLGLRL
jgi:1-acyl-sn-glycerol-3-phosphate acyltransferase